MGTATSRVGPLVCDKGPFAAVHESLAYLGGHGPGQAMSRISRGEQKEILVAIPRNALARTAVESPRILLRFGGPRGVARPSAPPTGAARGLIGQRRSRLAGPPLPSSIVTPS
jgi:hypothetical protein